MLGVRCQLKAIFNENKNATGSVKYVVLTTKTEEKGHSKHGHFNMYVWDTVLLTPLLSLLRKALTNAQSNRKFKWKKMYKINILSCFIWIMQWKKVELNVSWCNS